jgi:hypothetical protein
MKDNLIILIILLNMNFAYAVPPPCSQEELLKTSDYAVEGFVVKVECGEAYDSKECIPFPESPEFRPELVSNCIASVKVTESLKGNHSAGDEVRIPFLKLAQFCQNGEPIIPGSAKKNFNLNSKIRYYNSASCEYWNLEELEKRN